MKLFKNITAIFICTVVIGISLSAQVNIALNKPVIVSSEATGFPAANMVDGKISRTSVWQSANGRAPHIIEIDLKKYYTINELRVHSGILDSEKRQDEMTQAAGFWSIKNFKLQYWDDANWSDFPKSEVHENRQVSAVFTYQPAVTTFKVRLVCDDGEPINIMEFEVFGTETPGMPAPPTIASTLITTTSIKGPQSATITVQDKIVGKTMKYVGYNQGYYMSNSNVSGWLEYSHVNSLRVWASMNAFAPETAFEVDKQLNSVEEFDKRKNELRMSPENNRFIRWQQLLPLYSQPDSSSTNAMVFNYALRELKRLNIDVILQMGSTDFNDTWENKWKQWQRYYALAYYAAKTGDVTMFAMQNEPNHRNSGPMKLDQWITGMQVVSDAVHTAIEDVNKKYGKKLEAKFVGPVTAGQNTDWWAGISKAIRTDYHGKIVDKDLLNIFSTHSYNSPAVGYEERINNIRKILQDNHPAGQSLPIAYTEIGRWMNAYLIDKEETMDSPSLFTEWAGIYANNMKNGGFGMWAFKFANTASGPYPRGIKSGHHYIWQGMRIVEDAYKNLASGKTVNVSNGAGMQKIVDNDKSDSSAWIADSTVSEKWAVIDLQQAIELGSAVIYTGSASGIYTAPDRVKNFRLQYNDGNTWKDIPGTIEKDNKYAQVFTIFTKPVTTSKVRFVSDDKGSIKVREIKLFGAHDGPSQEPSYDVSGIQRTGEVVRLFAKGFKDERPLYETKASVIDAGLDSYTSFDKSSGNYYIWLVQRGNFDYKLKLNLAALDIAAGSPVTIENVGPLFYGEVSSLIALPTNRELNIILPAQTVMLLTIPQSHLSKSIIDANADATIRGGALAAKSDELSKELKVQLDASSPANNQVSYINFDISKQHLNKAQRVVFKLHGATDKTGAPFRLHVYAFPGSKWPAGKLTWKNAKHLDDKEALIENVGREVFVAGELSFTNQKKDHWLDVTDVIKKHSGKAITFIVVRETRQLGDDEDKGKRVAIDSRESANKPQLIFWNRD